MEVWEWKFSDKPDYCKTCVALHKERDEDTPCRGCVNEPPELFPENIIPDMIYQTLLPYRSGMDNKIDGSILTKIMELLQLTRDEQLDVFSKLPAMEQQFLKRKEEIRKREDSKAEREAKKKNGRTPSFSFRRKR